MNGEDDLVGATLLGKLRVLRLLGAGGLGSVYEVEHRLTHHRHALKVLHRRYAMDSDAVARLVREAGVSGRVRSPRLVQTLDVGQLEDGRSYLLMELLEGRSWRERLHAEGSLHPTEAIRLGIQVCEGLAAAHAAGVIHRDLKPDNVFLQGEPGREEVRLLDFGIAKNLPGFTDEFGALTVAGGLIGTPQYLSPEQGAGDPTIGPPTDQYALAVMLYESLTGQRPFQGANIAEVISRIHEGHYTPISVLAPHAPPALVAVVERGMRLRAETRFESIEAFAAGLGAQAQEVTGTARTDAFAATPGPGNTAPTAPLPGTNAPLPGTNAPLPGTNAPLPGTNAPLPGTNAPLPGTNASRPPTTLARPPSDFSANLATGRAVSRTRARWPWIAMAVVLLFLLLLALLGGAAFVGWRTTPGRAVRPAIPRTLPVPAEPPETAPEAAPFSGIPTAMLGVANAHPTDIAGLMRTTPPQMAAPRDGHQCVQTIWTPLNAAAARVTLGICDGDTSATNLFSEEVYESGGSWKRETTVRGIRVRHTHIVWDTGRSFAAEAIVAGRYRVNVSTSHLGSANAVVGYLATVDLEALAALARDGR